MIDIKQLVASRKRLHFQLSTGIDMRIESIRNSPMFICFQIEQQQQHNRRWWCGAAAATVDATCGVINLWRTYETASI